MGDAGPSPPGHDARRVPRPGLTRSVLLVGLVAIALATAVALSAALALRDIASSARDTRDVHLPTILESQRTIINVERLGRYGEVVYHSPDRRERRNARLAAQILAQDSALERNPEVYQLVWKAYKDIRAVAGLRDRQGAAGKRSPESEAEAAELRERSLATLAEVTDILSLDATGRASVLAADITRDARRATAVAVAGAVATLVLVALVGFLFQRHLVQPIMAATRGLERAEYDETPVSLPPARLREMDAIVRAVGRFAGLLSQLRESNDELRRLSTEDGLTCVANRRYFDLMLAREIRRSARHQRDLSLILLDIDHFKPFNDTYGHQHGDECLRLVSQALTDTVHRPGELVARYGGEEFAVILPEVGEDEAMAMARRMAENLDALGIEHASSPVAGHVTASMGVATVAPGDAFDPAGLIAAADQALYLAKQDRNTIRLAGGDEPVPPTAEEGA